MNKIGRWIILAVAAAFLLGFMPTVVDLCGKFFVFTEGGIALTKHFYGAVDSIFLILKDYVWHITIFYAAIVAFLIFMEGQNPDRTILWMLVLIFLPVVGVLLYLVLGPDLQSVKNKKIFKKSKRYSFDKTPFPHETDDLFLIGRMLHAASGADLLVHNSARVLINGDETFPAVEEALRGAKKFIHMEFFIIRSDSLGARISAILREAAKRGVKVRVMYDAVGSFGIKASFIKEMEDAGVLCRSFMPVSLPIFRRRMNFRNHRKIIVIDGEIGFTGGLNIGDEYEGKGPLGFWRDTFVRLEGEAVGELHKIFVHDWCACSKDKPASVLADCGQARRRDWSHLPVLPMQVVASGVDNVWRSIAKGYYGMISRARQRVWITTPYLVPGPALMNAMIASSLAGVDVRVMIPSKKDHFLVYWGSRSNIEPLLRAGVRVFMYKTGFIHTKSALSDCCSASVGTCNMDVRSLDINFENQLFIYDKTITEIFASQFERDMKKCREIKISEWEKRPMWQKVLESFGRLYSAQI